MEISSQVSEEEGEHLAAAAPDIDILELVRNSSSENNEDKHCHVVRPAQLVSSLGLSIEDATRELCGLLSAVGGGEDGASFVFEKVELPAAAPSMSMVLHFHTILRNEHYDIGAMQISDKDFGLCRWVLSKRSKYLQHLD